MKVVVTLDLSGECAILSTPSEPSYEKLPVRSNRTERYFEQVEKCKSCEEVYRLELPNRCELKPISEQEIHPVNQYETRRLTVFVEVD
jgi:hypothetical protein